MLMNDLIYAKVKVTELQKGRITLIKAIFFDLDDTLLWDEKSVKDAFQKTCTYAQSKYELDADKLEERVRANATEIYASYPTYEFTKMIGINPFEGLWGEFPDEGGMFPEMKKLVPEYRRKAWTMGLKDLGIDDEAFGEELGEVFRAKRKESPHLYEDSLKLLDMLKENYELLLLTNGSPALQNIKLELTPELRPYFKNIVISGGFGKGKPDPAIFEHALSLSGYENHEVIMVGDNLNTDILGASRTGITSVWINQKEATSENVKADYEIAELMELLPILDKLNK